MKLTITVTETREIQLDETLLGLYADGVRDRFEMSVHDPVNMHDMLSQAVIDGDIEMPENWELEDWDDDLTPQEITDLAEGE